MTINFRDYYRALVTVQPDEASELLQATAKTASTNLFGHTVQETVLNNAVDYFTLGWTRMLQSVLDLAPPQVFEKLLPKYSWLPA